MISLIKKTISILLLLLNEYDRYFIIQILTEGAQEYPSFNFAAKNGTLSLITNSEGTSSLINWAWTETV